MADDRTNGGISPGVHDRVVEEMETFTEALEAAAANPTPEALDKLRQAADRLMRATGRVLIDVERLLGQAQKRP